jgi:hypothetical protein
VPSHAALGLDFDDMAVAYLWVLCRLRALNRRLGRRDNGFHDLAKTCYQKITGRRSIISPIGNKALHGNGNLAQKIRKGCRITDIIRGQIGANDLTADKIKTNVKLVLSLPLDFDFVHSNYPNINLVQC